MGYGYGRNASGAKRRKGNKSEMD
ncbi:uncharacterized protein G2W53_020429 [Senna tora]|uniref:Uncharacterized protein n=1 Tax=Senna tora TaxID=362788 RepID=A0A834WMW6_9FABA|nr:uncharacterized protein G2W53_020429 [Senna tora]